MTTTTKTAGWILILASALLPPARRGAAPATASRAASSRRSTPCCSGWMTGLLGKVIAIAFILVGLVAGVMRQSIMGFVVGVAAGVGMLVAPGVIDNMYGATLPLAVAMP